MKRNLLICLLLASFFFLMSSLSFDNANIAFLSPKPNLPAVPYDYDLDVPEHIQFGAWSFIDTLDLNSKITSDGATLGRVLFYDEKLSFKNNVSCGSCHKQEFAFADDVQFSKGIDDQLTKRNSPNLNDLSLGGGGMFFFGIGTTPLFWDCRETDLETMVLQPIEHEAELGKDLDYMVEKLGTFDYYAPLFEKAFGDDEISKERVASALAQFIRSMSSFDSKFDLTRMGLAEFSDSEQRGEEIFITSCGQFCHGEPLFSTTMPMNNGLDSVYTDVGMAEWDGNSHSIGKFKSPSLRNIELTAPYMHDGRFETLEEVIDFYSEEVNPHPNAEFHWVGEDHNFRGFEFTDIEKNDLHNFLKTLTTPELLTNPKWSDPFDATSSNQNIALANSIEVYPNPVEDKLSVNLGNRTTENTRLTLFDLKGKRVWQDQMSDGTADFQINTTHTGVYILQLNIDGATFSKKLFFR